MDAVQRAARQGAGRGQPQGHAASRRSIDDAGSRRDTTVIKIEPANPQVVYVPTYNPTVVYGAWPYPAYPPYSYYPPGYVAGGALLAFAVGVVVGAALWGNCNWGGGDVNINVNRYNNFNQTNISNKQLEAQRRAPRRGALSRQRHGAAVRQGSLGRRRLARGIPGPRRGGARLHPAWRRVGTQRRHRRSRQRVSRRRYGGLA